MKRAFKVLSLTMLLVLMVTPALAAATFLHVPLSLPGGWESGNLSGVWGSGANNIYAVGGGYDGNADVPMLYHYVGSGWMGTGLALPDGWWTGQLNGVWGSSQNDVYVVGFGSYVESTFPLLYHYDGHDWTEDSPDLPAGWWSGELNGVWGSGSNDVYTVGGGFDGNFSVPLIYHYNGVSWTEVSPDLPGGWWSGELFGVGGSGPNDIYAVGNGLDGSTLMPLLYHYNGNSWVEVSLTLPSGWGSGELNGVWNSASNNVYAVGSGVDGNGSTLPLIYHYDGYSWTEIPLTLPGGWNGGELNGVWGSGWNDIYVVGSGYYGFGGNLNEGGGVPLIYYYDGNNWTDDSPDVPTNWVAGGLLGVWGSSMYDVYAAGSGSDGVMGLPLLYHASTPPQVGLNALSHNFGDQLVDTTSDAFTFIVTNTGGADLHLGTLAITGQFAFSSNTCDGATIAQGGTCTFSVTFSPTSVGAKAGSVSIPSDAATTPDVVSLSGTGVAPALDVSPASHDFGSQQVGTTSDAYSFTVTSTGSADLHLGTLGITGQFAFSGNTCNGATIVPGGTCIFSVTFSPTSTGAKTGSVSIPSDAATTPDHVSLSGTGVAPALEVSPASHDFGNQLVGTTSDAYGFTVTSTGGANLHVGTLSITGQFALSSNTCNGATIAPGGTCNFGVTFSPTSTGAKTGSVSIPSDAATTPDRVSLSGTGVAPALEVNPASHDFGGQQVGTTSGEFTFIATNTGDGNLVLGALRADGEFALGVDGCSGQTVAPASHCDFGVTFSPLSEGAKTGYVYIPSNAATSEDAVALNGHGYVLVSRLFASIASQDGFIIGDASSNVGDSASAVGGRLRVGDAGANQQIKTVLSFDTSSLPDSMVFVRVRLRMRYVRLVGDDNPFDWSGPLHMDIASPFGTSELLEASDFEAPALVYDVAACGAAPISSKWYVCELTGGFNALNLAGLTQFRVYFATGDNGDKRADYLQFVSGSSFCFTNRPLLLVEYYVP